MFAELVAELLVAFSEKPHASAVAHITYPGVLCAQPRVLLKKVAG